MPDRVESCHEAFYSIVDLAVRHAKLFRHRRRKFLMQNKEKWLSSQLVEIFFAENNLLSLAYVKKKKK